MECTAGCVPASSCKLARTNVRNLLGMVYRHPNGLHQSNLVCLRASKLGLCQVKLRGKIRANRIGKRAAKQAGRVDSATSLAHLTQAKDEVSVRVWKGHHQRRCGDAFVVMCRLGKLEET